MPVWYNGATWVASGTTYIPPSATVGTTVYTVIDSATVGGCKDLTASGALNVTVTVNPSPSANPGAVIDSSNCGLPTGGVSGVTVSGGVGPYHYQWYNGSTILTGDTLPTLSNVGVGTYSVLITDANNCPVTSGTTSFNVVSGIPVVASFTANPSTGTAPLAVTFTNSSTGSTSYIWDFGNGTATSTVTNPSYAYNLAGTYTAVLVASNGTCADTAYTVIIVDVATTIIIPNVFSPNGDNINDEFVITTTGMKSLTCDIFNRWGQRMFTIGNVNQSWDGTLYNGNTATDGTYYYMIKAVGIDGKTFSVEGYMTLIR